MRAGGPSSFPSSKIVCGESHQKRSKGESMQTGTFKKRALALGVSVCLGVAWVGMSGCEPTPRRQLTTGEKLADMEWIYSMFGQNYAPMKYKEKLFGFEFEKLKDEYREKAKLTANNDEFYHLMLSFVAQFKDAHTSGSLNAPDILGRAQIAFLGFSGKRKGNKFVVTELFPTVNSRTSLPIKVGTEILKIDGMTLADAIKSEFVKYRDLGQDDTNFTYHVNRLFTRVSLSMPLPKKDTVTLTIPGPKKTEVNVVLPWVVKDLALFREQQAKAHKGTVGSESKDKTPGFTGLPTTFWSFDSFEAGKKIQLGLLNFQGMAANPQQLLNKVRRGLPGFNVRETFQFVDDVAGWIGLDEAPKADDDDGAPVTAKTMSKYRDVPSDALFVPTSRTYPSYVYKADKELVGYIWLHSFSPGAPTPTVLTEVNQ